HKAGYFFGRRRADLRVGFVREERAGMPLPMDFLDLGAESLAALGVVADLAFFSCRSFRAVCSAPRTTSSGALASRMWVAPPRPQPPFTGRKMSGSSSTKAA